jgi:hypothetical protein
VTTYPVNIWLVRHGIKHTMGRPVLPAGFDHQPTGSALG